MSHGSVEHISSLASMLQLVNQDRIEYLGDPDVIGQAPLELLLSEARADEVRAAVLDGTVGGRMPQGEGADTTHLTVVDADGNVASITHSLGNISGVVTPGLGFMYNNGMNRFDPRPGRASSIKPRKARLHLMMPSMAFRDDNLAMAFGAPGGNAILSALTQAFTNVVDFGMGAVEAVSAPRIHAEGDIVWCEARARTATVEALRDRGHNVVQDPASLARGLARAQMIIVGPGGALDGGSDPRGPMGVARSER
jgi:gamma-glutamyltranspeptidase/glutathione hydrolase